MSNYEAKSKLNVNLRAFGVADGFGDDVLLIDEIIMNVSMVWKSKPIITDEFFR